MGLARLLGITGWREGRAIERGSMDLGFDFSIYITALGQIVSSLRQKHISMNSYSMLMHCITLPPCCFPPNVRYYLLKFVV